MKRRKERLAAAGLAAAMAAMLVAGCRAGGTKATPENLIRDMEKNSEAVESVLMNIKMEMEMAYDSQSMALRLDMDNTRVRGGDRLDSLGGAIRGMIIDND